jgi:hypothetical protein
LANNITPIDKKRRPAMAFLIGQWPEDTMKEAARKPGTILSLSSSEMDKLKIPSKDRTVAKTFWIDL